MTKIKQTDQFDQLTENQYNKLMSRASPTQNKLKNFPAHVRDFFVRLGHLITDPYHHRWENNTTLANHLIKHVKTTPENTDKAKEIFQKIVKKGGLDPKVQKEFEEEVNKAVKKPAEPAPKQKDPTVQQEPVPEQKDPAVQQEPVPEQKDPAVHEEPVPEQKDPTVQPPFNRTTSDRKIGDVVTLKLDCVLDESYANKTYDELVRLFAENAKLSFDHSEDVLKFTQILKELQLKIVENEKFIIIRDIMAVASNGLVTDKKTIDGALTVPSKILTLDQFPFLSDFYLKTTPKKIASAKNNFLNFLLNQSLGLREKNITYPKATPESRTKRKENIKGYIEKLCLKQTSLGESTKLKLPLLLKLIPKIEQKAQLIEIREALVNLDEDFVKSLYKQFNFEFVPISIHSYNPPEKKTGILNKLQFWK